VSHAAASARYEHGVRILESREESTVLNATPEGKVRRVSVLGILILLRLTVLPASGQESARSRAPPESLAAVPQELRAELRNAERIPEDGGRVSERDSVLGDRFHLYQVALNLIANSVGGRAGTGSTMVNRANHEVGEQ
jgi:hypothetical protein